LNYLIFSNTENIGRYMATRMEATMPPQITIMA
jgi:hypothetical protein